MGILVSDHAVVTCVRKRCNVNLELEATWTCHSLITIPTVDRFGGSFWPFKAANRVVFPRPWMTKVISDVSTAPPYAAVSCDATQCLPPKWTLRKISKKRLCRRLPFHSVTDFIYKPSCSIWGYSAITKAQYIEKLKVSVLIRVLQCHLICSHIIYSSLNVFVTKFFVT